MQLSAVAATIKARNQWWPTKKMESRNEYYVESSMVWIPSI